MIRHILCPADFSRSSQRALHFAADLASRRGATVTLLHVLDPSAPEHAGSSLSCDRLQDLQRRAQRAVARLTDRAIEIELAIGAAYDVILNRAQRPAVDLVVMSLGSRSGIGDLLRGSLTERILSHVSVPVLVVPNSTPWESEDAPVPRTIVMAIDFSSVTEAVIQAAKEQSELWRARLVALHVVPPPRDASSSKEDTNSKEDTYWLSARPMGRPRAVRERSGRDGILSFRHRRGVKEEEGVELLVVEGRPLDVIPRVVRDHGVGMVVLGDHFQASLRFGWIGSTCHRLVRRDRCPTLVVKVPSTEKRNRPDTDLSRRPDSLRPAP